MEGFLSKKGRGESTFGRRTWKKRWFVLDGQYLTYYENFDLKTGKPVNKKGTLLMKGCDIKISDKSESHPFSFAVTHDQQSPIFLDAETDNVMKMWMNALKNAAMGIYGLSKRTDFSEYMNCLGIPQGSELTMSILTKSYRKLSLKAHPDKGGDPAEYEKIQEAYNLLKNHLEDLELASLYDTVHYEVIVEKGGSGIGLGMLVVEDKKKACIKLKSAQPNIIIRKLDEAAGGKMKPGDVLVGIDDDNTVSWTLARVVQRLNDFRVPIGSVVRLTYSRSVRKDGEEDEVQDAGDVHTRMPPTPDTVRSANNAPFQSTPTNASAPNSAANSHSKFNDIDGDYFASPAPDKSAPSKQTHNHSGDKHADKPKPSAPVSTTVTDGYISVIAYESLKSMNEELEQQLEACRRELRAEKKSNDQMKADVVALSTACKKLKKEEMKLKIHIQQLTASGGVTVSEDQLTDSLHSMLDVADRLQQGQNIETSIDTENYLNSVGLSQGTAPGTQDAAKRNAISAAAAVDATGLVLKKWALSGDPAISKLSRLEERLKKMQENNNNYHQQQAVDVPVSPIAHAPQAVPHYQYPTHNTAAANASVHLPPPPPPPVYTSHHVPQHSTISVNSEISSKQSSFHNTQNVPQNISPVMNAAKPPAKLKGFAKQVVQGNAFAASASNSNKERVNLNNNQQQVLNMTKRM